MLCVTSTVPLECGGLGGGAIYIDTEASFNAERIVEIAQQKFPTIYNSEEELVRCAESIIVYPAANSEELFQILDSLEEVIIEKDVKFVVIDSIAAIARREFDTKALWHRQALLGKQAALLKLLAENYDIPVLVTNQVTTTRNAPTGFSFNSPSAKLTGSNTIAALGTAWAHCVNTRLILQHFRDKSNMVTVAKSPVSAVFSFPYIITDAGLQRTDEPAMQSSNNYWGDSSIETKQNKGI